MLHQFYRILLFSFIILLLSPFPAHAQAMEKIDVVEAQFQEVVALRESFTLEQVTSIEAVLAKHDKKLNELRGELAGMSENTSLANPELNQKLFLPLARTSGNTQDDAAIAKADGLDLVITAERTAVLIDVVQKMIVVQAEIDQTVLVILDPSQQTVYAKYANWIQKSGQGVANKLHAFETEAKSAHASVYCTTGAVYTAYLHWYAWYQYLNAYYDYVYFGNGYARDGLYYGNYAYYYARIAMLYAGGAYIDAQWGFGYDSLDYSTPSAYNLAAAWDNAGKGLVNSYNSYYYYNSSYGYNAWYNGDYAKYYADLGYANEVNC